MYQVITGTYQKHDLARSSRAAFCFYGGSIMEAREQEKTVVLVGNPNVGKSVFFSALTGQYQEVSNFPGTTVEVAKGYWNGYTVIDTPGVYGLSAITEEERVVRDTVLSAAFVINVVNGVNLHRDLFLTRQLIDAGIPLIVVLNFADEVNKYNLEIDMSRLEELLGVPVVSTIAVENKGLDELRSRLTGVNGPRQGKVDDWVPGEVARLMNTRGISRAEGLLIAEGDRELAERYGIDAGDCRDRYYQLRRKTVDEIIASVVREKTGDASFLGVKLGQWMLYPLTGFPILAVALWVIYEVVGVLFAQHLVGLTEGVVMGEYYQPAARQLVGQFVNLDSAAGVILTGRFGILTMAVTYVFGLLFPLVLGFFLVLSLLEDCGYLPRIAILLDRATGYLGLNGQAIIPLILGFGCVTMASITTRILGSRRERRIAIFLLALAVPCSAQLAFITAILAGMGPGYLTLYVIIIFSVLTGAGTLMGRFLPGTTSPLMVDLPPLRMPRPVNVWAKTWERTSDFIKEAIPLFAGGALLLSLFEISGFLEGIQSVMQPVTAGWLGLPEESASAFIMGFIRRDFGTAGMMSLTMLPLQQFVALVTLTLFVPCIASTMVIFKELGWRDAVFIWPAVFVVAFTVGGVVNKLLNLFHGPWVLPMTGGTILLGLVAVLGLSRLGQGRDF